LPLHALTTKTTQKSFPGLDESAKRAFNTLKTAFTTAPLLRHFNSFSPSTIITDASDFALASILLQPDNNGLLHPVAFHSSKFTPAEINYEIHDKELLSIIDCFRDMCSWLIGSPHPITVISDHKNLEYFMSSRLLNRRQARWSMFLSEYDFQLDYAPGKKNPADSPSRRPDYSPKKGDDVLLNQNKPLLTDHHLYRLFPSSLLQPES
jgi:RNase H-like domain found in reverse transcriptase